MHSIDPFAMLLRRPGAPAGRVDDEHGLWSSRLGLAVRMRDVPRRRAVFDALARELRGDFGADAGRAKVFVRAELDGWPAELRGRAMGWLFQSVYQTSRAESLAPIRTVMSFVDPSLAVVGLRQYTSDYDVDEVLAAPRGLAAHLLRLGNLARCYCWRAACFAVVESLRARGPLRAALHDAAVGYLAVSVSSVERRLLWFHLWRLVGSLPFAFGERRLEVASRIFNAYHKLVLRGGAVKEVSESGKQRRKKRRPPRRARDRRRGGL